MSDSFVIEAEVNLLIGDEESFLESYIIARVKTADGEPVLGLKKSNFSLYDMGRFFGSTRITRIAEIPPGTGILPGTYRLEFNHRHLPLNQLGQYGQLVFALVVNKRRRLGEPATGQTLMTAIKLK